MEVKKFSAAFKNDLNHNVLVWAQSVLSIFEALKSRVMKISIGRFKVVPKHQNTSMNVFINSVN